MNLDVMFSGTKVADNRFICGCGCVSKDGRLFIIAKKYRYSDELFALEIIPETLCVTGLEVSDDFKTAIKICKCDPFYRKEKTYEENSDII